jgi:hypothetical protein
VGRYGPEDVMYGGSGRSSDKMRKTTEFGGPLHLNLASGCKIYSLLLFEVIYFSFPFSESPLVITTVKPNFGSLAIGETNF